MYLTEWVCAALSLEHAGLARVARPRPAPLGAGLAGGVVAVRLDDLAALECADGSRVLAPATAGRVREGDLVAWCCVVAVAPVTVDADGRVAAQGWLPDHVRLGVLEEHLGEGVVERVVAGAAPPPQTRGRQRLMSLPLVARLVLAMTLLPHGSYVEALAQLVGPLPRLAWTRGWHVPSSTVITDWRRRLGVAPMRELFWRVAGHIVAAADPAGVWHGLRVCALDGSQVRVPDTEANRAAFGPADGPFPLPRVVLATARAGRAILGAIIDACHVGEQTLIARLLDERPDLFTSEHVYLVDRNFLGFELIEAIHRGGQGAHLVMRVKDGIKLPVIKRFPDGSYESYLRSRDGRRRLRLRVVEYDITLPGGEVSELFCVATSLLDHEAHPAAAIADLYQQRWSAAETTIGECKSTITDAGPSRGPILRSEEPELVRQEIWAWLAATQLTRRSAHAATLTTTGVSPDQISFTVARREATRSMVQGLVTATSSPAALADAAERAARAALANLVTIDRDRHSPRTQKSLPKFPHTATTKTTTRGPLPINLNKPPPPDTS